MDNPTKCPTWCARLAPHRLNHDRQIHWAVLGSGRRLSVDLHRAFDDDPPEVYVYLHDGDQLAGEAFTPRQVQHLSRVLAALDHGEMAALADRLGAAAAILDDEGEGRQR